MNIDIKYAKPIDQLKSDIVEQCEIEWNTDHFILNNKEVTVISDIDSIPKRLILYYYNGTFEKIIWVEILANFISASADEIVYEVSILDQGKD